jgi:hypothetical protein
LKRGDTTEEFQLILGAPQALNVEDVSLVYSKGTQVSGSLFNIDTNTRSEMNEGQRKIMFDSHLVAWQAKKKKTSTINEDDLD